MKFLHNRVSDSCVHAYNEERLSIMNAKGHAGNVKKFMNELGHLSDIFFLVKGPGQTSDIAYLREITMEGCPLMN